MPTDREQTGDERTDCPLCGSSYDELNDLRIHMLEGHMKSELVDHLLGYPHAT